jgi:hypothetical protein
MTITVANIDIGDLPNDGTGDPLRIAFEKINQNFIDLANGLPAGPEGSFQYNANGESNGTANFTYVEANNTIRLGANILPISNTLTIGTVANTVANLYVGNSGFYVGNINVVESGNILSFPIRVLPSAKASFAINNLNADGNITANGSLSVSNLKFGGFTANTSNNAADQIIFEYPATAFKTGKVVLKTTQNDDVQTATIDITKAGTNATANFNVYGTIFIGAPLTNYEVDIGYGNIRLKVSPLLNTAMVHEGTYQITG